LYRQSVMYAREGVELERSTLADVPGQELLDAVDRMVGDAGQHIAEIGFGIETVEFGSADQAVDRGGSFAAGVAQEFALPLKIPYVITSAQSKISLDDSTARPFGPATHS
jgi:hypothetical protein